MKNSNTHRVTLKDVAEAAHCSVAVASRALSTDSNQNSTVNKQTAQAVIEAARVLKYIPRHGTEKQKPLGQVGVFIPAINSSQLLPLIKGISSVAEQYNTPLHYFANATGANYRHFADHCLSRSMTQGVISYYPNSPVYLNDFLYMYDKLRRLETPLVIIHNNAPSEFSAVSVKFDNYYGGKLAGEYLASLQCTAYYIFCGFILPISESDWLKEKKCNYLPSRVAGCYNYLSKIAKENCNIISNPQLLKPNLENIQQLQKLYDVIDTKTPGPQGVFCTNGAMALNLSGYLQSKGIEVGKQVKLIGYDDNFFCEFAYPSITTIRQPFELMGRKAMQKLFNMMQRKNENSELLKPELIKRTSA